MIIDSTNYFSSNIDLLIDVSQFQTMILNRMIEIDKTPDPYESEIRQYKVFDV
jgi:hypothetical protein